MVFRSLVFQEHLMWYRWVLLCTGWLSAGELMCFVINHLCWELNRAQPGLAALSPLLCGTLNMDIIYLNIDKVLARHS